LISSSEPSHLRVFVTPHFIDAPVFGLISVFYAVLPRSPSLLLFTYYIHSVLYKLC
jgi:hypothetical protein